MNSYFVVAPRLNISALSALHYAIASDTHLDAHAPKLITYLHSCLGDSLHSHTVLTYGSCCIKRR